MRPSGLAGCVRKACRGGIYPSRKPCRSPHTHGRAAALLYEPVQIPPSGWPQTQNLFVGAGFIPPAGVCAAAGPRDDASIVPYRGLSSHRVCGFPVGHGPAVGRRGGIYPSRGCLRRRGVRRDEGIPPYGRFIGSAYAGKAACFRRGVRGFPVGRGPAVGRRGGLYPSRGCSRRRGVRRAEGIPPYGHFIGSAYTGKSACFRRGNCGRGMPLPYMRSGNDRPHGKPGCPPGGKPIVGADSISAQGVRGAAGLPGRDESRPYEQISCCKPTGRPRARPQFNSSFLIPNFPLSPSPR